MQTLIVILLILAITGPEISAVTSTEDSSCSEQKLRDCEEKNLQFFYAPNKTVDEYDAFCENLKNDSQCPIHLSEVCKTQYESASAHYTKFFLGIDRMCHKTPSQRISFCMLNNQKEIGHCYILGAEERHFGNPKQPECQNYKFVDCMHGQVLKYCVERREDLASYFQAIKLSFPKQCSGCISIINNHWTLDFLAFLSIALSHKIFN